MTEDVQPHCPLPITDHSTVQLAHGGGGLLMNQLIEKMFLPAFSNEGLNARHDGAVLDVEGTRLAFSTDSYVVNPIFFPGGDIGSMAVNGTVNDLAMCGARPLYLSAGMIIEEGFPMEDLWRITRSMSEAAKAVGVAFVTGDTKVVDKGKGDGIFINTAGIGLVSEDKPICPASVQDGDAILLSGDLGRHGTAIMASREGLEFETEIESDCAPLSPIVQDLLDQKVELHCLRDLTRGGLASALVEIAEASELHLHVNRKDIPVTDGVRGACEILGLDPAYVANEGRMAIIVPQSSVEQTLSCLKSHDVSANAALIGTVTADKPGLVTITSEIGVTRILDMISGEQLPRIC